MATAQTLDKSKLRISFNNARLLSVLDNRNLTYEVLTVLTNFYFSEMLDAQYAVAWIDTHADFDRKILDTETQGVFNMEITKQEGYYILTLKKMTNARSISDFQIRWNTVSPGSERSACLPTVRSVIRYIPRKETPFRILRQSEARIITVI